MRNPLSIDKGLWYDSNQALGPARPPELRRVRGPRGLLCSLPAYVDVVGGGGVPERGPGDGVAGAGQHCSGVLETVRAGQPVRFGGRLR